jgi:hypothetical protein
MASINGRLQCGCVEGDAVALCAILANVVDAGAEVICSGIILYLPGCEPSLSGKTSAEHSCDG